jgi:hypothetical protein
MGNAYLYTSAHSPLAAEDDSSRSRRADESGADKRRRPSGSTYEKHSDEKWACGAFIEIRLGVVGHSPADCRRAMPPRDFLVNAA